MAKSVDIQKTQNEVIRVEISEFQGKEILNIRVWTRANENADYRPTQKGIAFSTRRFEAFMNALEEVREHITL